jgi:3-hydroxyisobutyrate dehydrogenase-like beta-hydroxyacid dehydrogenase
MPDQPVVAILSPGEMGHAIGGVLVRRGVRVITSLGGRSERTAGLTRKAGVVDVGSLDRVVAEADLVMSVMPSAAAPTVAREVAARLPGRSRPLTFVECNAIAPHLAREIAGIVADAGGEVVDAGIVGSPPTDARSPRFYASGPRLDAFLALRDYGLDVRPLGPEIGQASAMKMCYAALTKGLTALGTELLLAAEAHHLLEPVFAELRASQPSLLDWLERSVPAMPPKSRRWVSEMGEIAATLEDLGLSPGYHRAAASLYSRVGDTRLGAERPESRDTSRDLRTTIETLANEKRETKNERVPGEGPVPESKHRSTA